jgi:trimeric autotransporter adhesin
MNIVRTVSHLTIILALSPLGAAAEQRDLSSLPAAAQSAVSAALGTEDAVYHPTTVGDGLDATNPAQHLLTHFGVNGADFRCSGSHFRLALRSYGYGSALTAVGSATPHANRNRVEYRRGPLTEWYVNGPVGLEQGFTIIRSPGKANGQPLTIALALLGDVTATMDKNATGLTLAGGENHAAMHYAGLTATDAAGKQLRA